MDYYLENLRTGAITALNPDRTLIGSADHATIRLEKSAPFLAALVVKYPGGWSVHGLSDDALFNKNPLRVSQQVSPKAGDVLEVEGHQFRFAPILDSIDSSSVAAVNSAPLPSCFAYIRFPDGMEECRTVDHNLVFGRLRVCHVRFPDTKLSRLNAILAAHEGKWYVHALGKGVIARNQRAVSGYATVENGDELIIGPLNVRIEMDASHLSDLRAPAPGESREEEIPLEASQETVVGGTSPDAPQSVTDAQTVETTLPDTTPDISSEVAAIYSAGLRLDHWLKGQQPQANASSGLGSWFETQRERLKRFWYDTPETSMARALRTAGKPDEAFVVLDRALRARPDSPDLLRELFRLYDGIGLYELCFRPLRQIEKMATARGETDIWVLETLARTCERIGRQRPGMFDRAVGYWTRLERATGVNYSREKAATMAKRTLCAAGFSKGNFKEE